MKPLYKRAPAPSPLRLGARLLLASCMAMAIHNAWADAADVVLPVIVVRGAAPAPVIGDTFPATGGRVDAHQLEESNNVVTVDDALKYLPSLLVRKRYDGDTQAPLATRTTGINASARSLVMADLRVHYQLGRQWSAAGGVDNLNNRDYFLYHPFPQRTVCTELKFNY